MAKMLLLTILTTCVTSEAEEEGLEAQVQLGGHEEDQPDGGATHIWIGADS